MKEVGAKSGCSLCSETAFNVAREAVTSVVGIDLASSASKESESETESTVAAANDVFFGEVADMSDFDDFVPENEVSDALKQEREILELIRMCKADEDSEKPAPEASNSCDSNGEVRSASFSLERSSRKSDKMLAEADDGDEASESGDKRELPGGEGKEEGELSDKEDDGADAEPSVEDDLVEATGTEPTGDSGAGVELVDESEPTGAEATGKSEDVGLFREAEEIELVDVEDVSQDVVVVIELGDDNGGEAEPRAGGEADKDETVVSPEPEKDPEGSKSKLSGADEKSKDDDSGDAEDLSGTSEEVSVTDSEDELAESTSSEANPGAGADSEEVEFVEDSGAGGQTDSGAGDAAGKSSVSEGNPRADGKSEGVEFVDDSGAGGEAEEVEFVESSGESEEVEFVEDSGAEGKTEEEVSEADEVELVETSRSKAKGESVEETSGIGQEEEGELECSSNIFVSPTSFDIVSNEAEGSPERKGRVPKEGDREYEGWKLTIPFSRVDGDMVLFLGNRKRGPSETLPEKSSDKVSKKE